MEGFPVYVVDASVVYKWYVEEESSGKAREILDNFVGGQIEISAPDLVYYEVANALRWNHNNKKEDVKEVIDNLDNLELDIIVPTPSLLKEAVDCAYQHGVTIYDAVYLKLADNLGFTLLTADKKFFNKVKDVSSVNLL